MTTKKPSRGFSLIEILVALALGFLLVGPGVFFYQKSVKFGENLKKGFFKEALLIKTEQWLRDDLSHAGFMGCRYWQEQEVPIIIEDHLVQKIYQEAKGQAIQWLPEQGGTIRIQRSIFWHKGRPVAKRNCEKIHIMKPRNFFEEGDRSFASIEWHLDTFSQKLYRRDYFAKKQMVFEGIKQWEWEWINPHLLRSVWTLVDDTKKEFHFEIF